MYRKLNIKILAAIFVALLIVVILIELADSRKGSRTFREDLVEVDREQVTSLEIHPKVTGGKMIRLTKENDLWMVEADDEKYKADPSVTASLINELNRMKPESVVATNEDRWEQYEVTDSLGTRVRIYSGADVLADLFIGKFSFSQPRKMTSYVRLKQDKEVYGVDGMLGMSFNRNLNSFRDKTVIKSASSDWRKLTFTYPADSSFVLEKAADSWMVEGQPADSASVADYFGDIRNLSDSRFAESKPVIASTHKVVIEGNNDMEPIEINGFYKGPDSFIIESSQNKGNFFDSTELATKIFVSRTSFN